MCFREGGGPLRAPQIDDPLASVLLHPSVRYCCIVTAWSHQGPGAGRKHKMLENYIKNRSAVDQSPNFAPNKCIINSGRLRRPPFLMNYGSVCWGDWSAADLFLR